MNEYTYFFGRLYGNILKIFFFILLFGVFSLYTTYTEWIISILLVPIFAFVVKFWLYKTTRYSDKQFVLSLIVGGIIIRVISIYCFSELLTFYNDIPFLSHKDDYLYNASAERISQRWHEYSEFKLYKDIYLGIGPYSGYPNISAMFMYIFGSHWWVPRVAQSVFSVITTTLMYGIARTYTDRTKARLVGIIATCSPLLITFSSLQLKDTFLLFFCILTLFSMAKILHRGFRIKYLVLLLAALPPIMFFRPASLFPLIIGPAIYSLLKSHKRFTAIIITLLVAYFAQYTWVYISNSEFFMMNEEFIESQADHMMNSDMSQSSARLANTSLVQLAGAPVYIIMSFFLPCPLLATLVGAETINYTAFSLVFHTALMPFMIGGAWWIVKKRKEDSFKTPFLILIVFILYKIGQSFSLMTLFSPRQSLMSLTLAILFIPCIPFDKISQKVQNRVLFLALVVTFIYNFVRLYSHGQLF